MGKEEKYRGLDIWLCDGIKFKIQILLNKWGTEKGESIRRRACAKFH